MPSSRGAHNHQKRHGRAKTMDARRKRRQRDPPRARWYALWRSLRFARHFGLLDLTSRYSLGAGCIK